MYFTPENLTFKFWLYANFQMIIENKN